MPNKSPKAQLEAFHRELSAVMPADFKDWHENDPAEWPVVAAQVIRDLRAERDELRQQVRQLDGWVMP